MKNLLSVKFAVLIVAMFSLTTMCKQSKETTQTTAVIEESKPPAADSKALAPGNALSIAAGIVVYDKNACSSCHLPEKDQTSAGMGPSLAIISKVYKANGGKPALLGFFNGANKAIVAPGKFTMMKASARRIQGLTDQQKSDLADYLLSY